MEGERLTCHDCGNTYKSKATLYVHRRQYCQKRTGQPGAGRRAERARLAAASVPRTQSSFTPAVARSPASAQPRPCTADALEEAEFNEDDVAYWREFVSGELC